MNKRIDAKNRLKVAVVIPVHNRLHLTMKCLDCLRAASNAAEIMTIVVDDGSTDGTAEWLRHNLPDATILPGDGNLWFGGAVQKAIEYVKADIPDVDYFMTLNNDTFLLPGCIDAMIEESNGEATVGVLLLDRPCHKIHCFGAFWRIWKGWIFHLTGHTLADHPELANGVSIPVQMHNTTATLIPMKWLKKIKGINVARYPQHKADTQLFSQIARVGSPLRVTSLAIATNDPEPGQEPYSIRNRPFLGFLKESLTDKTCPMHMPTLILSAWETAPTRLHAVPVILRMLLQYCRQILISLALCLIRPVAGRSGLL